MATVLCVALLAAVAAGCGDQEARPLIATKEGLVRGVLSRSAAGEIFYSFKGIRYAQPPVGGLRFQSPHRHPGWSGVADATDHGDTCLQYNLFKNEEREGSEDCLFLNVYTPRLPDLRCQVGGVPVMVYIHGGGFNMGSGNDDMQGPDFLMDDDVVLVTFNYRIGAFGFFTTDDSNASGNYGLLDQVMVLQWVRDNIASFGGDPQLVTIFGLSAGGTSVSLLVLSPLAKDLFHHAISQSGTAIAGFGGVGRQRGIAQKYAKQLNCSADNTAEIVSCVRNVSAERLLRVTKELELHGIHLSIRVDKEANSPFLPEEPRTLLKMGKFSLIPWMNGVCEVEGSLYLPPILANKDVSSALFAGSLTQWGIIAGISESEPNILDCGADWKREAARIYEFYVGNDSISIENQLPLANMIGDRISVAPMSEEVHLASAHTPVYKYVFDHADLGRLTFADLLGRKGAHFGPSHGDDTMYLFKIAMQPIPAPNSPTYTMIRFIVSLWTSFARTGRPSSHVLPTPDWPIFTEQGQQHMRLNSQPSVGARAFEERVQFWQSVPINEPWRHAVRTTPCHGAKVPSTSYQTLP